MSGKWRNQFALSVNQVKGINKNRSGMGKEIKRSFVFNIDWRDVLMDYPAEVRYEVYDAIIEYAASGKLLDLKPLAKMAFSFIKKEMDNNLNRLHPSGKRHWNWKGGVTDISHRIRESSEYKQWRKSVFIKDKYTCQHCGKTGGNLNAHHIKPFSLYPDMRFDINNGITLCRECHIKIHKTEREWNKSKHYEK